MYFSTYDPYDDRYDLFLRETIQKEDLVLKNNNDNKECIICWEKSTSLDEVCCLQVINIIHMTCLCNVYIHEKCLCTWVKNNNSCPICRTPASFLDISLSSINENIIHIWYIFLYEYKRIIYIIFSYLICLQIFMVYFLIIRKITYDEISNTV